MRSLVIAGLLAATIAAALGAEIKKKDGTVVSGEIVAEDGDSITLKHRLGEVKLAKADIESIDRAAPPTLEEQLDKLKEETLERLRALERDADAAKKKEAVRALRDAMDDVRHWSTRSPEERCPQIAPPSEAKAAPPAPKALDFVDVLRRWEKLKTDPAATSAQRDNFATEMHDKLAKATVKIVDVAKTWNGSYTLRGSASGVDVSASFDDPESIARLVKLKPGATIAVQGSIRLGSPTELHACRLR